jgi:hypothetical protein
MPQTFCFYFVLRQALADFARADFELMILMSLLPEKLVL